jgi:hypothetical protein
MTQFDARVVKHHTPKFDICMCCLSKSSHHITCTPLESSYHLHPPRVIISPAPPSSHHITCTPLESSHHLHPPRACPRPHETAWLRPRVHVNMFAMATPMRTCNMFAMASPMCTCLPWHAQWNRATSFVKGAESTRIL